VRALSFSIGRRLSSTTSPILSFATILAPFYRHLLLT